jgi:hypothetical protein
VAALLSMLLWPACGPRTVRVEVPTPVLVELDRCAIRAGDLPPLPHRDGEACARAYGDRGPDAACYAPAQAHLLAALLDTLIDLYLDAAACSPPAPATPTEGAP